MPVFEVIQMSSEQSLETSRDIVNQTRRAGLARWKLETLTGLLGIRALTNHQHETEKNIRAENRAVRRKLWQDADTEEPEDADMGNTILGDVTHPTPVIVAGANGGSSGLLKAAVGMAIGALLPTAGVGGFLASQLLQQHPPAAVQPQQQQPSNESLDVGLGKLSDYLDATPEN
jgi:hypothetical protein